jgi:hypothetical protein
MRVVALLSTLICVTALHASAQASDLVVHEWGTFTSFQDRDGATIAGINVDDEPVPDFVHRLARDLILSTHLISSAVWKGAPGCHPDVTLRLETPVLYFYPNSAFDLSRTIDVHSSFAGGWLTEYYPAAKAQSVDFPNSITPETRGTLDWQALRLGPDSSRAWPKTTERVWLAPRAVRSSSVVETASGESEKYLFYRGVGHIDAPLVVRQHGNRIYIALRADAQLTTLPTLWVVRVDERGRVAYSRAETRAQRDVTVDLPGVDTAGLTRIDALRTELTEALTAQHLFPDEAQAMLKTWQLSYFESEGLRVFFLLPQTWTERQLPLSVSVPADITRVMMGRIELESPYQRQALQKLLALPAEAFADLHGTDPGYYQALKKQTPATIPIFLSLGRFRDALIAHERMLAKDTATRQRLDLIFNKLAMCQRTEPSSQVSAD